MFGMNMCVIIYLQCMVINKFGVVCNFVLFRNGIYFFQYKIDKVILFVFDVIYYFMFINYNFILWVNFKVGCFFNLVYIFCCGDQQFGRYIIYLCIGGVVRVVFNYYYIWSVSFCCMISVKVSSIIVNYGDINVNLFYYGFLIGLFLV